MNIIARAIVLITDVITSAEMGEDYYTSMHILGS